MCGVLGLVAKAEEAAEDIYAGLWSLQHRGKESAGIATFNGSAYFVKRGMGTVEVVFGNDALASLKGQSGIGHVRYSTTGGSTIENAQPVEGNFRGGSFWIAHNGNLVRTEKIRKDCEEKGYIFKTATDTEIIAALIHYSEHNKFLEALKEALSKVEGTYALTVLYKNDVYGARDKSGNRPLSIGFGRGILVFTSESSSCDVLAVQVLRDVYPGELVILRQDPFCVQFDKISNPPQVGFSCQKPCIFEYVYFLRPDSVFMNRRVQLVREEMGRRLWRESKVSADIVVAVPDSGNFAASGVAEESRLPLVSALFRSHYVGRTFIEPLHERREKGLRIKLNIIPELVVGKRVVVVDDSIVRATVIKRVIKMLREAGAKEIHVRISSPPYRYPCYYGIDTYKVGEKLVAARHENDVEAIRKEIGADSLAYLSMMSLKGAIAEAREDGLGKNNFCDACFSGNYHIPIK